MATRLRRYTISIPPKMDQTLSELKKEKYYQKTQSEMIRDLIVRGLSTVEDEKMNGIVKGKTIF